MAESETPTAWCCVRAKAIGNINELIRNSVLVEEEKAKSDKKDYDKLFRFYVPVRVGNNVYTARISALHNSQTQSFDMSSDLYDVILEMNQRTASAMISDTESGNADTISIAEMLQNVKGADGKFYITSTKNTFEQSDVLFQDIKYDSKGKVDTNSKEFKKWITDTRSNGEWSIQIYKYNNVQLLIGRLTGKYKGAGFLIPFEGTDLTNGRQPGQLECIETTSGEQTHYTGTAGAYCQKIFGGTLLLTNTSRIYKMP